MEHKFKSNKKYVQDDIEIQQESEAFEILGDISNEFQILKTEDHMLSQYANNLTDSQRKKAFQQAPIFKVNLETEEEVNHSTHALMTFQPDTYATAQTLPALEDDHNVLINSQQDTITQLNFAICQYEEILQKLTSEFQGLIQRNTSLQQDEQRNEHFIFQLEQKLNEKDLENQRSLEIQRSGQRENQELRREVESLERVIKDLKMISQDEQSEQIIFLKQKSAREEQEQHSQRQANNQMEQVLRQTTFQLDQCIRENKSLHATLEIMQKGQKELRQENFELNSKIDQFESIQIQVKAQQESQDSELKQVHRQYQQTQIRMIEQHQSESKEKEFQIQQMEQAIRQMRAQISQQAMQIQQMTNQLQKDTQLQRDSVERLPWQSALQKSSSVERLPNQWLVNAPLKEWDCPGTQQFSNFKQSAQSALKVTNEAFVTTEEELQSMPAGYRTENRRTMSHTQMFNTSSSVLPSAVPASGQAAGKRTTDQALRANQDEIQYLQNALSALQIDKEKVSLKSKLFQLENDYRRIGSISRNKQQIEHKQQLENELDLINRNVQNVKHRLRCANAL